MKKIIVSLAMFGLLGGVQAATFTATTEKPLIIKLSHVVKEGAPKGLASEKFKQIMEAKFPGRVLVEVYHDNKLFKDREETEALELGVVDVIVPTTGKIANFSGIKEFELFDLPFLFNTPQDIIKFTQSSSGENLLGFFNNKSKKLYAITYWPNDFKNYIGSKFYKVPDDFKGQVARIEALGTAKLFFDTLNVKDTQLIAFSELPKALKKEGEYKVDVAENPNSSAFQSKLYESSKFLTISKHNVNSYVFITNKRWFNNLPEDIKLSFIEAAKESGLYHFDIAQKNSAIDLENFKAKGVKIYTWTEEERRVFKKKAVAVHENYLKNINREYLNEVYKVVR